MKIIEWSEYILDKSLKYSMFKEEDQVKIDKIKYDLITGSTTKNHSQNLSAEKCREIGLNIKYLEDNEELQDLVLSIHHACISYFIHMNQDKLFINQMESIYPSKQNNKKMFILKINKISNEF